MYHELQSDNLQNSLIQLLGVDRKPTQRPILVKIALLYSISSKTIDVEYTH